MMSFIRKIFITGNTFQHIMTINGKPLRPQVERIKKITNPVELKRQVRAYILGIFIQNLDALSVK